MADETKISVKFLVDKEKRRVVHAEVDKDFVDILFSFLTLPLGTIVKVLKKQSSLGSMDTLYDSVEKLEIQHLQTEACKTMLLNPCSEAAVRCEILKINVDDISPRVLYVCKEDICCSKETCLFSSVTNVRCIHCKGKMDVMKYWGKGAERLFVEEGVKYIISDDLLIEPVSAMHIISMIKNMNVNDYNVLEERALDFGINEIEEFLKRLLVSRMPLTDFYYQKDMTLAVVSQNLGNKETIEVKTGRNEETDVEGINIRLLVNKEDDKVLCVEAEEDFIDLVFSFLTMPLGLLIKTLNKKSAIGCIDNIYSSVANMSSEYIEGEDCRSILLSPKLGPFFGSSNNVLKLDERKPSEGSVLSCFTCYWKKSKKGGTSAKCEHGIEKATLKSLNPKSPDGGTEKDGGYAKKGPGRFMVTDDLRVSPVSTSSIIEILNKLQPSIVDVVEREVNIGEVQALDLLRASLISKTPLSDVFTSHQYLRNKPLCPID